MMFSSSQQWIVVGTTSASYGCALANYAPIFTRVTYYLDWIYSMNVSDAVTIDTATTIPMITNFSTTPVNEMINSTNNGAASQQYVSTLLLISSIILPSLILFNYNQFYFPFY